jgi:hypothetical protein
MKTLLVLLAVFICGCVPTRSVQNGEPKKHSEDSFLYMTFIMNRDSINHVSTIRLINTTQVAGYTKTSAESYTSRNFLQCKFLDKNNHAVSTQMLNHPLYYRAEVLTENQELKTSTIELNQSEFVLRINHSPKLNKLIIIENSENQSPRKIYEYVFRNSGF